MADVTIKVPVKRFNEIASGKESQLVSYKPAKDNQVLATTIKIIELDNGESTGWELVLRTGEPVELSPALIGVPIEISQVRMPASIVALYEAGQNGYA